jgi:hypothetical protein
MPAPAFLLDALQSLLDAEEASIFRFMRRGTPYLTRADADTRREVEAMAEASDRHAAELAELITRLGGTIRPAPVQSENQFLAYLSLQFLLPKLAEAKRRMIERYVNTLRALGDAAPPEVIEVLNAHLAQHRHDLATLELAIAQQIEPA